MDKEEEKKVVTSSPQGVAHSECKQILFFPSRQAYINRRVASNKQVQVKNYLRYAEALSKDEVISVRLGLISMLSAAIRARKEAEQQAWYEAMLGPDPDSECRVL